MSLLEGHADVVMDDVGPEHVPSVEEIRRKFDVRRKGAGSVDKILRRLLGLEAKMRQYKDGAAFVRSVQETVGVDGFNAIWSSPETLPRAREITDPQTWVRRIHG
jgi:putative hydrolase